MNTWRTHRELSEGGFILKPFPLLDEERPSDNDDPLDFAPNWTEGILVTGGCDEGEEVEAENEEVIDLKTTEEWYGSWKTNKWWDPKLTKSNYNDWQKKPTCSAIRLERAAKLLRNIKPDRFVGPTRLGVAVFSAVSYRSRVSRALRFDGARITMAVRRCMRLTRAVRPAVAA